MLIVAGVLSQPALAFDHQHGTFATFLGSAVSSTGTVDYTDLKGRRDVLDQYLTEVANAPASGFSKDEQLAFYTNAYNAYTISLILDENPKSIQDLDGGKVWDQRTFDVGRQKMTLNQIEHGTIRKIENGRIHAIVNCASKGCPPLPAKPITPDAIQGQLDQGARRWVNTNAFRMDGSVLQLSKIFDWYAEDFTGMAKGTASDEDKKKAGVEFVKKYGASLGDYKTIEWMDYDWSLNSK